MCLYFSISLSLSEQNQLVQHNPKIGVIASSSDLALQSVQVHQAGNFSCVASNVEGDGESNTLELKVMCTYIVYVRPFNTITMMMQITRLLRSKLTDSNRRQNVMFIKQILHFNLEHL